MQYKRGTTTETYRRHGGRWLLMSRCIDRPSTETTHRPMSAELLQHQLAQLQEQHQLCESIVTEIIFEYRSIVHADENFLNHSNGGDTQSRNLYKKLVQVNLHKKLDRLTRFLEQDFSCTSFLHRIQHSSIPYKKLAWTCTKI